MTIKFSLLQTGHKRFIRLTKQKQKYNKVHENAQNIQKCILHLCILYVIMILGSIKDKISIGSIILNKTFILEVTGAKLWSMWWLHEAEMWSL